MEIHFRFRLPWKRILCVSIEGVSRKILTTKERPIVNMGATIPCAVVTYEMERRKKGEHELRNSIHHLLLPATMLQHWCVLLKLLPPCLLFQVELYHSKVGPKEDHPIGSFLGKVFFFLSKKNNNKMHLVFQIALVHSFRP